MKYPIYLVPNQSGKVVVLQGKRSTFEDIERDLNKDITNKRILHSALRQFRDNRAEIIRVTVTREEAAALLDLLGLSY